MALSPDQLNTIYQNVLFRNVDTGGIAFFANRTDISDAQVRQQIELSAEATQFVSPVVRLFQEVLGRVPDAAGLKFFSTELRQGFTLDQITQQFLGSGEYAAKTSGVTGTTNSDAFVNNAFQAILGRTATAGELPYFRTLTTSQVLSQIANSTEATQTNAANVLTFLDSVAVGTPNTGTLTNQTGQGGTSNGGTTYTLTTGPDNVPGTAGNDVINGVSPDTLQATDTINGGAGFDTLNITTLGTANNALGGATISNIEAVQVRNTGAAITTATVNAQQAGGALFLNSNVSTGAVAFSNAAAGSVFGLIGDGVTTTGDLAGSYVAGAKVAAVTLAAGTKGGTVDVSTGTDLNALVINSTGAANTITGLTSNGNTKTVTINANVNVDLGNGISALAAGATETISGAATSVKLGNVVANALTIDASGLTAGGVTAAINNGVAAGFTLKGGAGNDTISVGSSFTNTLAAGSINAGAGTDVINLTGTAVNAATGAAFTGFETLRNSGTVSQDASLFSTIATVQTNGSGAGFSGLTAAQAAAVQVLSSNAGATFALKDATGTADVLGLTLKSDATINTGTTDATVVSATGLTVTGFETLNVAAASGVSSIFSSGTTLQTATTGIDSVSIAGGGAANLKTVNVSGAFAADVNLTNAVALQTVDLSANTAGVHLTTGAVTGALTVTGSAAADVIEIGAPNTTAPANGSIASINAGAGNDIIKIASTSIGAATVINGGAGTDTLEFTDNGVTLADNTFRGVSQVEKIVFDSNTTLTFNVGGNASNIATANGGVLDVKAVNLVGAATVDASGLTGTNALKLVLTEGGLNTGDVTVTSSVAGADNITINAASSNSGKLILNGGNNTAGITFDSTGVVTANATLANNTITTGSGNDSLKIGAHVATINTGTGTDAVTLSAGDNVVQQFTLTGAGVSSTTNATSITNFGITTANSDTLDFTTAAVITQAQLANGFNVTNGIATKSGGTLADFVTAIGNSTTAGAAAFVVGSDTYVGYSDGVSGVSNNDHLVKLVGVTATSVSTTAADGAVHIV